MAGKKYFKHSRAPNTGRIMDAFLVIRLCGFDDRRLCCNCALAHPSLASHSFHRVQSRGFLAMVNFTFTIEPDQMARAWVVYKLKDAAGAVQFVGHCRLSQIAGVPDARANNYFRAIFPPGRPMTVEVINILYARHHAQNELWKYLRENGRPFMLAHGTHQSLKSVPVVCEQTGEKFASIQDACKAHGLTPSALSNHLAQRAGYQSVKGKTYSRGVSAVLSPTQPPAVPLHGVKP